MEDSHSNNCGRYNTKTGKNSFSKTIKIMFGHFKKILKMLGFF